MNLVVLQSNYIPWKGYFDLIKSADLFVVYDSAQYTKNDWRNRNLLIGPTGPTWLTIPVRTTGLSTQKISEATITDSRWARKHWKTVTQDLGKRSYFSTYEEQWASWFNEASELDRLHDINLLFLRGIAEQLSISTPIVNDTDYEIWSDKKQGSATERLLELCLRVGASTYITGPAGLNYMDLTAFKASCIQVEVIDYSAYPEYPQAGNSFTHGVSVLDLLANVGPSAAMHLQAQTTMAF